MSANWPLRVLAGGAFGATVAAAVVRIAQTNAAGSSMTLFTVVVAAYVTVGVLIVERRAGNAVGPILFAMGLLVAAYSIADVYIRQAGQPAGASYVAWAVTLLDAPLFCLVALLFLLFPDGRFLSPRWRWVGGGAIGCALTAVIGTAVLPGPFAFYPALQNPFGAPGSWLVTIAPAFYMASIVLVAVAALSLVGRWRLGGPTQRAQLKWVAASAALIAVVMASYAILFGPGKFNDVADLAVAIALGLFPIAIGIAILRYRLFEIDRLVSRTIAYSVVTGGLVLVYLAVNLGLTTMFSSLTNSSDSIAVAASTLVAAALFTPLRRRVQRVVDHRFDRARFDAEKTAADFAERLRHEVDIDSVTTDLDTTIRAAVKPARLGLWLRAEATR